MQPGDVLMSIDGEEIGDEALANCITRVRTAAETMEEHPNAFEMMTATAFLWFAEEQCDITVLETGLGGRLDATNVITDPEAVVIMNIGLDHTKILGNSIAEIAERFGFSESKVKSMLKRTRDRLKAHLIKEGLIYERN